MSNIGTYFLQTCTDLFSQLVAAGSDIIDLIFVEQEVSIFGYSTFYFSLADLLFGGSVTILGFIIGKQVVKLFL